MIPKLTAKWNVNNADTMYVLGKRGTKAVLFFNFEELGQMRDLIDTAIKAAER